MCGVITIPSSKTIQSEMNLDVVTEFEQQIRVPPTLPVPVITNSRPDTLQYFTWSLIPFFSKTGKPDHKMSTFNATIERLDNSPLWKPLIGKKHCVVISSGFYEWNYEDPIKKKGGKPHLIKAKDSKLTFMAGLWSAWKDPATGDYTPSCTVITLPANPLMARIHNTKGRMPAFLTKETMKIWLDNELSFSERKSALDPVPDEFLDVYPISKVGDEEEFARLNVC